MGIMLAIANAVLAIVSVVLYIGTDRKEPSFEFIETNVIYEEGMEESRLLEGIKAYDAQDGDLTDKIVVEKKIENQEGDSIIIFYAVSDNAGNVAKCSREFTAIYRAETKKADSRELQEGPLVQSGVWSVLEGEGIEDNNSGNTSVKEDGEEVGGQDLEAEETEEEKSIEEEESTGEEDGTGESEDASDGGGGTEGNTREEQTQEREMQQDEHESERDIETVRNMPDPEAPVLELRVSEITTQVGVAPAWVNVIGTLSDDKDSYETLFGNLEISKYNINQAGTYQVKVSAKDSDGNKSGEVPLTIIVR